MIKIGRRGSLNAKITVHGTQGHVAYPHRADNPVHRLVRAAAALTAAPLDAGTQFFEPSSLQFTSLDVGNTATNVIPAAARGALNIRFNDRHTGASLSAWLRAVLAQHAERFDAGHLDQRRVVHHAARRGGRGTAPRGGLDQRRGAEAGHRRRHLRRTLHRARTARWRSSGWSVPACTRRTSACRSRSCARLAGIYRAALDALLAPSPGRLPARRPRGQTRHASPSIAGRPKA